jgi:hypothetical protein
MPSVSRVCIADVFLGPLDPEDEGTAFLPSEISTQGYGVTSQRNSVAYTVSRLHLPSVNI